MLDLLRHELQVATASMDALSMELAQEKARRQEEGAIAERLNKTLTEGIEARDNVIILLKIELQSLVPNHGLSISSLTDAPLKSFSSDTTPQQQHSRVHGSSLQGYRMTDSAIRALTKYDLDSRPDNVFETRR